MAVLMVGPLAATSPIHDRALGSPGAFSSDSNLRFGTFRAIPLSAWHWRLAASAAAKQMALESKPLIYPEVIRRQVRACHLPERVEEVNTGEPSGPA